MNGEIYNRRRQNDAEKRASAASVKWSTESMPRTSLAAFMCLIFVCAPLVTGVNASTAVSHTRSGETGPVRLTYGELLDVLEKARVNIDQANAAFAQDAENRSARQFLKVESAGSSATIKGEFSRSSLGSLPAEANDIWYQYEFFGAPISRIEIRLGDHAREVEIMGTSRTSVESVFTVILSEFEANETLYGGTSQRLAGAFLVVLIAPFLPIGAYLNFPRPIKALFAASGPVACLSLFLLPWDAWFPGTFVYQGDPSWLVENAPMLSLVGVALTIITFAISISVSLYLAAPEATSSDEGEADASEKRGQV